MRPKTLAKVAELTARGDSFDRCLANFLDEFYAAPVADALESEPPLVIKAASRTLILPRPQRNSCVVSIFPARHGPARNTAHCTGLGLRLDSPRFARCLRS